MDRCGRREEVGVFADGGQLADIELGGLIEGVTWKPCQRRCSTVSGVVGVGIVWRVFRPICKVVEVKETGMGSQWNESAVGAANISAVAAQVDVGDGSLLEHGAGAEEIVHVR